MLLLRTVMLPLFDPEDIVGLVRSAAGYRAFDLKLFVADLGRAARKQSEAAKDP